MGLPTNIDFCERVAGHRGFEEGGVTTAFLEEHGDEVVPSPETMPPPPHAVVLASVAVLLEEVRRRKERGFMPTSVAWSRAL